MENVGGLLKPPAGRRGRVRPLSPDLGTLKLTGGESLERQSYEMLKRAIMAGAFAPGSPITSRSIAEGLAISPSPVRDALKRLEGDGIMQSRKKSAYYLIELTRSDFQDLLDLRLKLEGYAAAKAAKVMDDDTLDELVLMNDQYMLDGVLTNEKLKYNFLFHFRIYQLAGSQLLIDLIENLWLRSGPALQFHTMAGDHSEAAANHERLIDALRHRNPRQAERALRRDLIDGAAVVMPRLAAHAGGSVGPGTRPIHRSR